MRLDWEVIGKKLDNGLSRQCRSIATCTNIIRVYSMDCNIVRTLLSSLSNP